VSVSRKDRWVASWFERFLGPLNLFVFRQGSRWEWRVVYRTVGVSNGNEKDEKTAKLEARRCADRWLIQKGKEAK
jgi:hypothetical protein